MTGENTGNGAAKAPTAAAHVLWFLSKHTHPFTYKKTTRRALHVHVPIRPRRLHNHP